MQIEHFVDKAICLNLDKRKDRWQNAKQIFESWPIDVERMPGIDGSKLGLQEYVDGLEWKSTAGDGSIISDRVKVGAIGCALSQMFCFKYAKQLKLNNFLFLEDDITVKENFLEEFDKATEQVPSDWDVLYLGGNHLFGQNLKKVNENVYRCEYTYCVHGVIFRDTVFDRYIHSLTDILTPCDVHYAESHSEINAYVICPHLIYQGNSYSDIEEAQKSSAGIWAVNNVLKSIKNV